MAATRIPTITEVDGMLEDVEALFKKFMNDFDKLTKPHDDEFKAGNYATAIQMAKDFFKNEKHNADARLNIIKNRLQKALALIPIVAPSTDQTDDAKFIRESANLGGGGYSVLIMRITHFVINCRIGLKLALTYGLLNYQKNL